MKRTFKRVLLSGALLLATGTGSLSGAQPMPACQETCLKGMADAYLEAVLAHDPAKLPLAKSYKATYNGKPSSFSEDFWGRTDEFPFHQYIYEPASGQVAFFGVAREAQNRGTFAVRLKIVDGKFTEIETLVGDQRADGVPNLISPNPLIDYVLPKEQQRSRKELVAIANSYFQALQDHDGSKVPVSPDCRRFDDGVQTSLNSAANLPLVCNDGFDRIKYMDAIDNRRMLMVDEKRGLVVVSSVIKVSSVVKRVPGSRDLINPASGMTMAPNPMFSHPHDTIGIGYFKIIDGKITEFHGYRKDMPLGWGSGW